MLALATPAAAQERAPAPAPPEGEQLPFLDAADRMTVPVRIAGAGPFPFVIDTGAQRTVISRELARTLGLGNGRTVRVTAMTSTSTVATVVIPSISVSTLGGTAIEAPALAAHDLGALGMLGLDALQGHALSIDFEKRVMTVTPAQRRPTRLRSEPGEIVVRAKSLMGQLVVTDAHCGGVRVRVVLDTGTSVSIGNEALRRRVMRSGPPGEPVVLTDVTGVAMTAPYGAIRSVRLGRAVFNRLPIAFADAPPFHRLGLDDRPAIMLGMDALQLFRRVDIDFANHQIRLLLPRDTQTTVDPG